ncbi:hypothetical protein NHX12_010692, partial [Muraenolepis orangiensis]
MDLTKKKLQQDLEDQMETEQQSKRTVERRVREVPLNPVARCVTPVTDRPVLWLEPGPSSGLFYSVVRCLVLLRNLEGEKKLRKDLRRTKVLLADTQIMLDHLKKYWHMPDKLKLLSQDRKISIRLNTQQQHRLTTTEPLHSLQSQLEFQEQSMVEKSLSQNSATENQEKEQNKPMQRQLCDIKEEMGELSKKETEASRKKHKLKMDIESLKAANQSLQVDLKLMIGDLQAAIEDDIV